LATWRLCFHRTRSSAIESTAVTGCLTATGKPALRQPPTTHAEPFLRDPVIQTRRVSDPAAGPAAALDLGRSAPPDGPMKDPEWPSTARIHSCRAHHQEITANRRNLCLVYGRQVAKSTPQKPAQTPHRRPVVSSRDQSLEIHSFIGRRFPAFNKQAADFQQPRQALRSRAAVDPRTQRLQNSAQFVLTCVLPRGRLLLQYEVV